MPRQTIAIAPVGDSIDNGFELGGARFYPWAANFAITPPSYYSDYLGPANSLPVSVPVGSLPSTIGAQTNQGAVAHTVENPWGRTSPLPWMLAALGGGLAAMYYIHYK